MGEDQNPEITPLIEHFFRTEYGKMVAVLTRIFRFENVDVAEDIVQETLFAACQQWGYGKIPDNPHAWLMTVAKNKALNLLKHESRKLKVTRRLASETDVIRNLADLGTGEDENDALRMMFALCDPVLPPESQIALVLKILCGFSTTEIARALLIGEDAATKRIYRAKERVKQQSTVLACPDDSAIESRVESVCKILYLLYNEGYRSTTAERVIRKELCLEAMRLCKTLTNRFHETPQVFALMALMCFHTARFDGRVDDDGAFIVFQDQDRTQWNDVLIRAGLFYLSQAARGDTLTSYHIEASIAAEYCTAPSFEETNWKFIRSLYERLYDQNPSPIVQLNIAVVTSKIDGNAIAIEQLLALRATDQLRRYPLLDVALGDLYRLEGFRTEALTHYKAALHTEASAPVLKYLRDRISTLG